jgi:hypothetical protein
LKKIGLLCCLQADVFFINLFQIVLRPSSELNKSIELHIMGIYPQPNVWQCGPFALKHALVSLGIFANEEQITEIAGAKWWSGADETQLGKAATHFGCKLRVLREQDPLAARRELVSYLRKGIPCLLCIFNWGHWITVVKEVKGKFIVLDSKDKAVLTILTWSELRNRWVYYDKKVKITLYDFHPVVPKTRVQTRAKFSLARVKHMRRPENRMLALCWDEFLADLLEICKPRTPLSENVMSMGEFLRRHETMIVDQVSFWHGKIQQREVRKILQHMHFVADTYGLIIHIEDENRAISSLSSVLTLWAASEYGVGKVYAPKNGNNQKT